LATIHSLPIDLVHLIAAGEVIDSLAAAVRELLDNALDAGATRLTVAVWPQAWQIRVTDNGRGIDLADLQQAAAPHATSKIHASADLWRIQTLGFRGEALHSLAQLGNLEICSRPSASEPGWRVVYGSQGEVTHRQSVAIAPGTIVTVSQLFANWPVRREGLPALTQQLRAIQNVIYQSALCHPTVTWQVQQQDRPWFSLAPGKNAQDILLQILPTVESGDLRSLQHPNLELVVGLPDRCHRQRPDWVRLAVNGRCVEAGDRGRSAGSSLLGDLEQSMLLPFQQTLPRHRYPVCFVHLRVPPEQIDWNRHPAKTEIYLQALETWQAQITQAIQQALGWAQTNISSPEPVQQLIKAAESKGFYTLNRTVQAPANSPESIPESQIGLSPLRAIAQIHRTYILAEHPEGMWLVEQHIAHERVLYEQLLTHWHLVELDLPIVLSGLTSPQVEQLQQLGITVEPFGHNLWAIRSAPALLAARDDRADALIELSLGTNLQTALVATACRSAIRNGISLSLEEMQNLLDRWQRTHNPRTCPHGRPICLILEESKLARFFRRSWVIGKSHGL
jgi:DNA mismatch repair protein MutL